KNGSSGRLSQFHRAAHMIDMSVGDDDLPDGKTMFAHDGQYVSNVVAGIDDDCLARDLVANHRAVTLQWTNGDDFVDHWRVLPPAAAYYGGRRSDHELLLGRSLGRRSCRFLRRRAVRLSTLNVRKHRLHARAPVDEDRQRNRG